MRIIFGEGTDSATVESALQQAGIKGDRRRVNLDIWEDGRPASRRGRSDLDGGRRSAFASELEGVLTKAERGELGAREVELLDHEDALSRISVGLAEAGEGATPPAEPPGGYRQAGF